MNVIRWRPYNDFDVFQNRIERLFDDIRRRKKAESQPESDSLTATWYPLTDIYETKDEYVFKLQVPGLAKEDINVELKESTLSITGEKSAAKEISEEAYHRLESFHGTFVRRFALPKNIDPQKINASLKDGILELRVAKAEEAKPKTIAIEFK